jgi:hypothetical protein
MPAEPMNSQAESECPPWLVIGCPPWLGNRCECPPWLGNRWRKPECPLAETPASFRQRTDDQPSGEMLS